VFDLDAREVIRDRLAVSIGGALALMRINLRGALAVRFIRRLDRGEHLRLVEQHLLAGVLLGGIAALRGAPVVLGLQPPYFLLEQHLAFDGLLMFALELLMVELDLLEPLVLFAQQPILFFGDIQANGKLGDFVRQCDGIFVRREHKQIVPRRANNSTKIR
jgi:hypothetical protein